MADVLSNQHGQSVEYWAQVIPDIQREYETAVLSGLPRHERGNLATETTARAVAAKTGLSFETIAQYLDMLEAMTRAGEIDSKYYTPRPGILSALSDAGKTVASFGSGVQDTGKWLTVAAVAVAAAVIVPRFFGVKK